MNSLWIIGGIVVGVLLVLTVAVSLYLARWIMTGKRQTLSEALAWQSSHYDISFYDEVQKETYTVTASDGYVLHVQLLRCPLPSTRYVIISHGYTDNHIGSLKYAGMYLDMGFNTVLYDLRGHGENASTFTTYGIREGSDLADLIRDTRQRYPDITVLGLHGESLGAATTVSALRYDPKVDFAVADCGFADIESVLRNGYRQAHAPAVLVDLADFGARLRYHYAIKQMRPVDALSGNRVPLLVIHGEDDSFILPEHAQTLYDSAESVKKLHIMEKAGHAESVLANPEEYRTVVEEFLSNLALLPQS